MIITFCGHSDFCEAEKYEAVLLTLLGELVGDGEAEMYLGGYGNFDSFAYSCCKKYKESHPGVKLVFVTPYLSGSKLEWQKDKFDAILYPELEDKPPRFAISYRNKFMVERADRVIAYINRSFGGAAATYKHAKKKSKLVHNLAELQI